jgi:hypothetical protein
MSVLIKKSICLDCIWKDSCQKLYKLHEMCDSKMVNPGKPVDIFDIIIITCSLKNYDRSYSKSEGMYYCVDCSAMHHEQSRIGKLHKNAM